MARKPKGLPEFQKLMRGIAQVPKSQLDTQVEKDARKKAAKRKK